MHQHPRPSPITASPASSPQTNPTRSNNLREQSSYSGNRNPSDIQGYNDADDGSGDSGVMPSPGPSKDAVKKLDQIIQNFYTKSAIVILQSRMSLPVVLGNDGFKKVNKWFQIETDDTNAFREELSLWKTVSAFTNRLPPLVVEIFLDLSGLTSSQSLVIVDDEGTRWDVLGKLGSASRSSGGQSRMKHNNEVILERWKIELKGKHAERPFDFGSTLPTVYKKCIVFFRSLYATAKFVPAWRLVKNLAKSGSPLKVSCRILAGEKIPDGFDSLQCALYDQGGPVTTNYHLGNTETPAGQFFAEVTYRNKCTFQVDDSEALLSSKFMAADEHYFQPSLAVQGIDRRGSTRATEPGSLPAHRRRMKEEEPTQTYGSMSTFHGDIPPRASSPISALRAAKNMGSDSDSPPTNSMTQKPLHVSRAALNTPVVRRPSISFQPFKAGSLSSSPGQMLQQKNNELLPPQSPQTTSRTSGTSALTHKRNRSSLTAGTSASLRGGQVYSPAAPSTSSSPKPAPISRYSSSFTHRRGRLSLGGGSKVVDDDQNSSGKQSLSSLLQPGSGILAEGGTGGSSESLHTDDENISDFLKLLDRKKTLQSFEQSGNAAAKRTSAQLSKYQSMRDSNNFVSESIGSSALRHRSSSSSSRQHSSGPPMVAGTSVPISSSPGKPVSPHTPHTPAIPSRLSVGSIAEYNAPRERLTMLEDIADDDQMNETGTNAIDIPISPRPRQYYPHICRSSSVARQHRSLAIEEDLGEFPFGIQRSLSLGAPDRETPSLSALINMAQTAEEALSPPSQSPSVLSPAPRIYYGSGSKSRQDRTNVEIQNPEQFQHRLQASASSSSRCRGARSGSTRGRGFTPPQGGSESCLADRGSRSGSDRGGRNSFTRTAAMLDYDDDLLFNMSELGRERRSIEEQRASDIGGGGYDAGRITDFSRPRGW